jgi:hypothetical protein
VKLSLCGAVATNRPLSIHQMMHEWIWSSLEWYWLGKREQLKGKHVPVPLCPPQIPHGLAWVQTRVSAVRSRWLTELWHGSEMSVTCKCWSSDWVSLNFVYIMETILYSQIFNYLPSRVPTCWQTCETGLIVHWNVEHLLKSVLCVLQNGIYWLNTLQSDVGQQVWILNVGCGILGCDAVVLLVVSSVLDECW